MKEEGHREDIILQTEEFIKEGLDPKHIHAILIHHGYSDEEIKRAQNHFMLKGKKINQPFHYKFNFFKIYIIIAIIAFIAILSFFIITINENMQPWPKNANTTLTPLQTSYSQENPILMQKGGRDFTITPLATYNVTVMVANYRRILFGPAAPISPIDISFVWGGLAENDYRSYMIVKQKKRFTVQSYKSRPFFNSEYLNTHFSNNHLIPANDNVKKGLFSIEKYDIVSMNGYLVSAKGDGLSTWKSSLTRNDAGCEIFYVEKVILNNKVYQ